MPGITKEIISLTPNAQVNSSLPKIRINLARSWFKPEILCCQLFFFLSWHQSYGIKVKQRMSLLEGYHLDQCLPSRHTSHAFAAHFVSQPTPHKFRGVGIEEMKTFFFTPRKSPSNFIFIYLFTTLNATGN